MRLPGVGMLGGLQRRRPMFGPISRKALALAMMVAFGSGCETGTEPEDQLTFDTDAALADHEALDLILQSDAMASFRALGAGVSFEGLTPEAVLAFRIGGAVRAPSTGAERGDLAGRIFAVTSSLAPRPSNAPIISQFRRGKTFVYDADLGRYVIDEDLTDAPETGVRFILYEAGEDGKPDPNAPVGWADLIDEGDESDELVSLRLLVVDGETEESILEYSTTLDVYQGGGEITVKGFFQGEEDRLDFEIVVTGSVGGEANTLDIDFSMGIAQRGFSIEGSVAGMESESGEGGEIHLFVQHIPDSFEVDVTGADDTIAGTVRLNGKLFANISGDPDDPTITSARGDPLTWIELLVLRQIVDSTEDVFDFWEDLLDPVDELVILALIL
jgi:hypothetical protein